MTKLQVEPIAEPGASLRLLERGDLPLTLAWRNHPDSRRWFHSAGEIAPDAHTEWFERYLQRDDDYVFVLESAGQPSAQVSIYDVRGGSAEFGRLLVDPARRGQGIGRVASTLGVRMAQERLGIASLRLEVKEDNVPAIRIYEELGFARADTGATHSDSILMHRNANQADEGEARRG